MRRFGWVHDNLEPLLGLHAAQRHEGSRSVDGVLPFLLGGLPVETVADAQLVGLMHEQIPLPAAYRLTDLIVRLIGLLGMLLMLRRAWPRAPAGIALGVSIVFAYVPFFIGAGASSSAVPFTAWALWVWSDSAASRRERGAALAAIAVLPWTFPFALSGMFLIAAGGLAWIALAIHRRSIELPVIALLAVFAASSVLASFDLFAAQLASDPTVWHRVEFRADPTATLSQLLDRTWNLIVDNHYNATTTPYPIMLATFAIGIIAAWRQRAQAVREGRLNLLFALVAGILVVAGAYFLYRDRWLLDLTGRIGLRQLNVGRAYYLLPALYCTLFFHSLCAIWRTGRTWRLFVGFAIGAQIVINGGEAEWLNRSGDPSFAAYRSAGLFEGAVEAIGRDRSSYRIGCLGFFPSIAHLNGMHTVGGYWYLYPLETKHRLRSVIAAELAKSEEIRRYFDDWGSRAYLVSAELGKDFFIEKTDGIRSIEQWDVDPAALRALGAEYVFSAVTIGNAERLGLRELASFSEPEAAIDLHVYEWAGLGGFELRNPASGDHVVDSLLE